MSVTCTLRALFSYARDEGDARLAYNENPCPETAKALLAAEKVNADYADLCLKADRMIGLEGAI